MSKIIKYENFLSEDLFGKLKLYVNNLMKEKKGAFTTSLMWDEFLVNTSALIARYELQSSEIEILSKIKKEVESKIPYVIKNAVLHIMPQMSYINWHSDAHCKAAFTIYLNENWDKSWGGYLMYEEDGEIKAIKPEKNLAVLQKTPVNHCVSTVNVGAEYRISLQFFLTDEKKNLM
jgi:Rps23 Pro-64 3,4-dihydroxylase Tpa1-like proline 4-hydroxylase